jgi:hypothetical protein
MSETVTQSEYARMRGVTPAAVNLALRNGRIPTRPDGRIDVAAADATWGVRRAQRFEVTGLTEESEARRATALVQSTAAKISMTRRRVEQIQARLIDRNAGQAAIGRIVSALRERLPLLVERAAPGDRVLMAEAVALIDADLRGLDDEALRVTRE